MFVVRCCFLSADKCSSRVAKGLLVVRRMFPVVVWCVGCLLCVVVCRLLLIVLFAMRRWLLLAGCCELSAACCL